MLIEAAEKLNLILEKSMLIGDRLSDLVAGARAGIKNMYHVETGHGTAEVGSINDALKRDWETVQNRLCLC